MLCFVAVLVIEYRGFRKRKKEYWELEHFAEFLSDLKNQFYLCKNVTESIFRAAEHMPGSLRKRLEEICFLLEEDADGATWKEERLPEHLNFIRLFRIQCQSAVQYGSGKNSTESVFVKNMTELRRDVQNECYRRKQAMYLFAGMGIVIGLPMVFLPAIRWFGTVTLEELDLFYDGHAGNVIVGMFFIITAGCYLLLSLVRKTDKRVYYRPKLLRYLFSQKWFGALEQACRGKRLESYGAKRLAEAGIDASGLQYWIMCAAMGIISVFVTMLLLKEMSFRVKMIAFVCAAGAGVGITMGFYKYLSYLRRLGMNGEVLNLQAVILLLIDVPNITLTVLLEVLGDCGALFQRQLYRCADEYAAEDITALERLFQDESNLPFQQLAGRIVVAERVGLKAAFEELRTDRHFFREQLRLDSEEEQKKKAANAQVIAFLPMMFLLFAYLIFPFLGASLGQMGEIFKEMEQIKYF